MDKFSVEYNLAKYLYDWGAQGMMKVEPFDTARNAAKESTLSKAKICLKCLDAAGYEIVPKQKTPTI